MPELIALVPAIVGAIGAGVGIEQLVNRPGATPQAPQVPTTTPAQATQTRQNQEASLSSAFPNFQALTGGSLSPESWVTLSQLATGTAGTPGIGSAGQDLLQKLTGSPTPPFTVTAGNTPGTSTSPTTGLVTGASYA